MEEKKSFINRYGRILLMIGFLVLAVIVVWQTFGDMLPEMFRLLKEGDSHEIELFLMREGKWRGIAGVVLLAALQVISVVFPGFAIQIAAGCIYSWGKAFLMCYVGFLAGNMMVFTFARRMGNHISGLVHIKNNNSNNWIRERMKTTKPGFVVAFVNLLPVLPNGIIPYIAANSSIRWLEYLFSIAVSSWIQILFNCVAGHFLIKGQYFYMVIALGIQVGILVFVTFKRQMIMGLIPGQSLAEKEAEAAENQTDDEGK